MNVGRRSRCAGFSPATLSLALWLRSALLCSALRGDRVGLGWAGLGSAVVCLTASSRIAGGGGV